MDEETVLRLIREEIRALLEGLSHTAKEQMAHNPSEFETETLRLIGGVVDAEKDIFPHHVTCDVRHYPIPGSCNCGVHK